MTKDFNDIDIYYLGYAVNSVNPLYLRIRDMRGQFEKGKDNNGWYLIIFSDADISRNLQVFGKVLELVLKKIQMILYSMIKIT